MVMVMAREKEIEKLPIVFVLLLVLLLLRCCLPCCLRCWCCCLSRSRLALSVSGVCRENPLLVALVSSLACETVPLIGPILSALRLSVLVVARIR